MAKFENVAFSFAVLLLVLAVAILVSAGATSSTDARDGFGRRGVSGGPGRIIEQFDANSDGAVTQKEIDATRTQSFEQYDSNGDGSLSLEEYEPLWREQSRPRMVDRFQSFDDDGSGNVTSEEFDAPTANLVPRLDENDDGEVTPDEMGPRGRGIFGRGPR